MAVAGILGEHVVNAVAAQVVGAVEGRASQDADVDALLAKLVQGETVLKTFLGNNPDPKLISLGASLRDALTRGKALHEEAHTAQEGYNDGVAALRLLEWGVGKYAPRLKKCRVDIDKELQSLAMCGQKVGLEVGQKVDARRSSDCWSAVSISEIKDGVATVVGINCDGRLFSKKLPMDFHNLTLSDWPTPEALYLPLTLQGERVLSPYGSEPNAWVVSNNGLKSTESGIAYRTSKNLDDDAIAQGWCATWNDLLVGVDQGDGWVRCWPKARHAKQSS